MYRTFSQIRAMLAFAALAPAFPVTGLPMTGGPPQGSENGEVQPSAAQT